MNYKLHLPIIGFVLLLLGISQVANAKIIYPEDNIFEDAAIISLQSLGEVVIEELADRDIDGNIEVSIRNLRKDVTLEHYSKSYHLNVSAFSANKATGRFKAYIELKGTEEDSPIQTINLTGSFDEMREIPVLNKRLGRSEIVADEDISWIEIPSRKVKRDTVTDELQLIGNSLRGSAYPFKPVRLSHITRPMIMERNSTIDLVFQSQNLSLKTVGIALDSGAKGDIIRVKNASSNKVVRAQIVSDREVTVLAQLNNI
mgnify:CR=1 FL=1